MITESKTTTVKTENPSKPASQNIDRPIESVIKTAQTIASTIVGLSALITVGGFIVVNFYLGRFTSIHGYNVAISQYIAAGIGFWVFGLPIGMLAAWLIPAAIEPIVKFVSNRFAQNIDASIRRFIKRSFYVLLILLYIVVGGLGYGFFIYGTFPHAVGGGSPPSIIIVFKEGISPVAFGLNGVVENPLWSESVLLLAELNDGILVKQRNSPYVVSIRSDSYSGILDPVTFVQRREQQEQTISEAEATPEATEITTPESAP